MEYDDLGSAKSDSSRISDIERDVREIREKVYRAESELQYLKNEVKFEARHVRSSIREKLIFWPALIACAIALSAYHYLTRTIPL